MTAARNGGKFTPAPTPDARPVLTTAEAAKLLQVSEDTLRGMNVPYVPIGTGQQRPRRRYLREQVLAWFKEQSTT